MIFRYVYNLVNHPQYEREVLPNDLKICPFLKEWILREIEVLILLNFMKNRLYFLV